jgi:hypothetical protein
MPKKPTLARKPAKRSPTKERRAKSDLAAAADYRRQAVRAAKREFDMAHAKGMRALRSGDMGAVDAAIKAEARAAKKLAAIPLYKPAIRRMR